MHSGTTGYGEWVRRFTLRGRKKVNAQWQLFTMVHNIEKIAGRKRAN